LRGRDAELAVVGERLTRARAGGGATIFIEGPSGFGKTRLLTEAADMARRLGVQVGTAAVDVRDRLVPMGVLIEALFDGSPPLLDRGALRDLPMLAEQRYWLLEELEALLERAALESPLLVCLDDLQWADGGSLAAVRKLPQRLSSVPIVWLLAFRGEEAPAELRTAIGRLEEVIGAQTLLLEQLDDQAVGQVIADVVRAEADPGLLEIAERAGGSPFLLVELLRGLLEEGLVRVDSAHAALVAARLPARLRDSMRDRLDRMSPQARQVAGVGSVLGRRFSFDQLGAMLALPLSALLEPVAELLRSDLLTEEGDSLTFRHDLIREAVGEALPASARRALQRQAVDVLLASGSSPLEVARQLVESAEPGDETAVATLLKAAEALGTSDPGAAADLSQRALELAPRGHRLRGPLVAQTVVFLHAAARSQEAKAFAETALRDALPPAQEAEVLLSVAGMFAISADTRADAGIEALALAGLPTDLRTRHLARLGYNLLAAGRQEEAHPILAEARANAGVRADAGSALWLALAEGALEYADGRFKQSLETFEGAVRAGLDAGEDAGGRVAQLWRGELLAVLDRLDESLQLTDDGVAAAQRDRQAWALRLFEMWRGRRLLQTGRIADAAAVLEGQFTPEDANLVASVHDASGVVALGRVALHTGDAHLTRQTAAIARAMLAQSAPVIGRHGAWVLALQAMAEGDAAGARAWLAALGEEERTSILPLQPIDVTNDVHVVRIAIGAGDDELAQSTLAIAEHRAQLNFDVPSMAATAAHVRGLLWSSHEELANAVALFANSPRPLARASAHEDLGRVLLDRAARTDGLDHLGQALELYARAGATWDASRVRGRLRAQGVRRRLVTPARPATGWAGLTDSELAVVRIVAEGRTNREVAERLFLSPHTVSSHLRHAFTKLAVNSRVELTRIVLEHEKAGGLASPAR
jgi:DNA-binding CsgD family transcriptional regulator/tetratricopeptide (TPR) repeat protein